MGVMDPKTSDQSCGLRRILVHIDRFGRDNFASVIMTARRANVVRAL
jgi:hypothetical protein